MRSPMFNLYSSDSLLEIDADLNCSKDSKVIFRYAQHFKDCHNKLSSFNTKTVSDYGHLPHLDRYKYLMIQAKRIQQNKPLLTAQEVFTQWKITKNVI